jgi:hypothetical protein
MICVNDATPSARGLGPLLGCYLVQARLDTSERRQQDSSGHQHNGMQQAPVHAASPRLGAYGVDINSHAATPPRCAVTRSSVGRSHVDILTCSEVGACVYAAGCNLRAGIHLLRGGLELLPEFSQLPGEAKICALSGSSCCSPAGSLLLHGVQLLSQARNGVGPAVSISLWCSKHNMCIGQSEVNPDRYTRMCCCCCCCRCTWRWEVALQVK